MSEISKSITHEHYSCFEARITEFSAYFLFQKGIAVTNETGCKILIPKHMWKSKIGLLEQI